VYRCIRRAEQNQHFKGRIEEPCRNSMIATHILEGKVFEMIRETMLDPGKLRGCIEGFGGLDDRSIARKLARVAGKLGALEQERRNVINRYAAEEVSGEQYIAARPTRSTHSGEAENRRAQHLRSKIGRKPATFCAANARWRVQTRRHATALIGHVERVIYNRYQVALVGFIPYSRHRAKASCGFDRGRDHSRSSSIQPQSPDGT
jgi:hypothetical protein